VPVVALAHLKSTDLKMPYNERTQAKKMTDSNLSKIRPKLRTEGRVSGNFGRNRVKANSPLRDIGITNAKVVNITTTNDYLTKMYYVLDNATDSKIKQFAYNEIKKILVQQGKW